MQFRTERRSLFSFTGCRLSSPPLVQLLVLLVCLSLSNGLTVSDLFPYGTEAGDAALFPNDDGSSHEECFIVGFPFYDRTRNCIFVSLSVVHKVSALYLQVFLMVELCTPLCTRWVASAGKVYIKPGVAGRSSHSLAVGVKELREGSDTIGCASMSRFVLQLFSINM